jgi:hypothetical protein
MIGGSCHAIARWYAPAGHSTLKPVIDQQVHPALPSSSAIGTPTPRSARPLRGDSDPT